MAEAVASRISLRPFALGTLAYALTVALLAASSPSLGDDWMPALFSAGAVISVAIWSNVHWADRASRYVSPGAVILLMCAVNRAFYVADYLLRGSRLEGWPFFSSAPDVALFKGEVITVLGTLLTVWIWLRFGGLRLTGSEGWGALRAHSGLLLVLYALAAGSKGISARRPEFADSLGQLLPSLEAVGLVTVAILPSLWVQSKHLRVAACLALSAPYLLSASSSGMKEEILLALIPLAFVAWTQYRTKTARAALAGTGIIVVALLASYVGFYRDEVWQRKQTASTANVAAQFLQKTEESGTVRTLSEGLTSFISRSNASYHRGWAVSIADEQGYEPALVFGPLIYVFVPRLLWPEKPPIKQGWEFSGLVFGDQFIAWSGSSTAAGFYASLYLGWGWPAVVIGAALAAVLLGMTFRLAARMGGHLAGALYAFAMVPFAVRLDDTWTVGVLSGPLISLVYVLAIVAVARLASQLVLRRRSTPEGVAG